MTAVATRKTASPIWQPGSLQVLLISQPKTKPLPANPASLIVILLQELRGKWRTAASSNSRRRPDTARADGGRVFVEEGGPTGRASQSYSAGDRPQGGEGARRETPAA